MSEVLLYQIFPLKVNDLFKYEINFLFKQWLNLEQKFWKKKELQASFSLKCFAEKFIHPHKTFYTFFVNCYDAQQF